MYERNPTTARLARQANRCFPHGAGNVAGLASRLGTATSKRQKAKSVGAAIGIGVAVAIAVAIGFSQLSTLHVTSYLAKSRLRLRL